MPTYECEEFRVAFAHADDATYHLTAIAADGVETTAPFRLPMSSDELETIVVDLGVAREVAPDNVDVLQQNAEQLGTTLFAALFDGPVGASYLQAQRDAATRNRGVRLTLSLAETPELLDVPWELLYRRPKFIASQRHSPVVRFLDVGDLPAPFDIEGPVRILGVVASPEGLPPLAVEDERQRVEAALGAMVERGSSSWSGVTRRARNRCSTASPTARSTSCTSSGTATSPPRAPARSTSSARTGRRKP